MLAGFGPIDRFHPMVKSSHEHERLGYNKIKEQLQRFLNASCTLFRVTTEGDYFCSSYRFRRQYKSNCEAKLCSSFFYANFVF